MDRINRQLQEHHGIGGDTQEWLVVPSARAPLGNHGIALCGVSLVRPGFRFVRLQPPMVQVLATCEGRGVALVEREWRPLTAGLAYCTPANRLHAYQAVTAEPWRIAWVMWHDADAVPHAAPMIAQAADAEALHDAILGLHREVHGSAQRGVCAAYSALIDALARRIGSHDTDATLRPVWEAVSARPEHPWSLAQLAALAGLGPERLRRRCQRETGRSPMHRVAELRLHHAAALLASTSLPIAAIAERVGYRDAFAFSTAFKRLHGHSPSAQRRQ